MPFWNLACPPTIRGDAKSGTVASLARHRPALWTTISYARR